MLYLAIIITFKIIQISLLDEVKAWCQRQNGHGYFNVTNFVILNLSWQTLLAGHFYLFNFIFY
jgi:hypothetical protein